VSGATSKRLAVLEKATSGGKGDSFTWYALALEYKSLGRIEDSLSAFRTLRDQDASYVPQYLLCGTTLIEAGEPERAREWLTAGLEIARAAGDDKALSEIQDALATIPA
jgi:tetratricopeptide (TPR) repeat protein